MAWTDDTHPHFQQWGPDAGNVQVFDEHALQQQPTTVFQQLSAAMPPPASSVRRGHVKEDLMELMMLQNVQMYQVIMNNMTMSALGSFGGPPHPSPGPEAVRHPVIVQEEMEDPEVYHHHYQPAPFLPYPAWGPPAQPPPSLVYQTPGDPLEPAPVPSPHRNRRAVPPPPPPSATRTVGADIPPATEYYDATERG